jgi:hypothetical protein
MRSCHLPQRNAGSNGAGGGACVRRNRTEKLLKEKATPPRLHSTFDSHGRNQNSRQFFLASSRLRTRNRIVRWFDVAYWPIASFRCAAKFGRYWTHGGLCDPSNCTFMSSRPSHPASVRPESAHLLAQSEPQARLNGIVARKANTECEKRGHLIQHPRPPRSASRLTGATVFHRPYILCNAA